MSVEAVRSGTYWQVVDDLSSVGSVRRAALNVAARLNYPETRTGEVGIVASEVTTNVFRHGGGGTVGLQVVLRDERPGLQILALDNGPGMLDITASARDGHSTGGTLGVGLGAVARLADTLDVCSEPGQGTVLIAELWPTRPPVAAPLLDISGLTRALPGEDLCGDATTALADDARTVVSIIDGLGHGPLAAASSQAAVDVLHGGAIGEPETLLLTMHQRISHTRGAAAAVATIDPQFERLRFAGLGNISAFVDQGGKRHALLSQPGIVGSGMFRTRQVEMELEPDAIVVFHSDGLREKWNLGAIPGLRRRSASVIAGYLLRDHGTRTDDASVLVVRRRR